MLVLGEAALAQSVQPSTHSLPLVVSASNPVRESFVRIINRSSEAGTVRIYAIDDSGQRFGPVSLKMAARASAHFNSHDLESGNVDEGLYGGVGHGRGDWRLELETTLDIEPLAYIRTADGFVTSMHDLLSDDGSRRYHVPLFNSGSNTSQVSRLRLINTADIDAAIEITGLDDRGRLSAGGNVRLTLRAGEARTISAQELEEGGSTLSGELGDGTGKWQLFVSSDRPIQIMNLLNSPTGHLTNLSTSPSRTGYRQREERRCDASLACGAAFTCVDGLWYPTMCGPANCDEPVGACPGVQPEQCDASLTCGDAFTCVDGLWYPTTCGPANCDEPIGACSDIQPEQCDASLVCGQAFTCVDGLWYPTTCGPANCDQPTGTCASPDGFQSKWSAP